MAYTYDPIFAADPSNAANVAANASIIIFDPADPGKAPITITDVTGSPLPNPITVNRNGFGPAFQHATLDRVGWFGAGFTGYFTSYEGMKAVAVEAAASAELAASDATAAAQAELAARIDAGDFNGTPGVDGSNVLPTDIAIAAAVNNSASATAAALATKITDKVEATRKQIPAARVASVRSRGALCIHLDDGVSSQYSIAAPIAEEYGGRLTFAICAGYSSNPAGNPGFMSHAQISDLAARGHEIANHSQTHANMTGQTATQRLTEWDASRNFIENTIGVPTKTFVLPFSAGNDAVFQEAYGRYGRVFGGSSLPYMRPMADMGTGIAHGRWSWATLGGAGQYVAAELINQAARTGSVLTLITHSVNGTDDANGVTEAEFRAVIELAASLGMAITTASEAIPEPPRVTDFGFEDASMLFWDKFVGGAQTAESVADAPLTGLTGGRSLKLHGDGTDYPYVLSKIAMPIMESGQHTLSARIRQEKTGGPQGAYIGVREYDANGVQIGGDINSAILSTTGSTPWQQISVVYTPNEKTRTVRFTCVQAQVDGDTFFDHLHHGPTRYGVLG